jgi:hypothetical protein
MEHGACVGTGNFDLARRIRRFAYLVQLWEDEVNVEFVDDVVVDDLEIDAARAFAFIQAEGARIPRPTML